MPVRSRAAKALEARVGGVPGHGAWAYLALSVLSGRFNRAARSEGPLVIARRHGEDLEDLADSLAALAPLFPGCDPGEPAVFADDERERLASLERLDRGARVVLATASGLGCPVPARQAFAESRFPVRMGAALPRDRVLERLGRLGYQRADFAESPGEFAARGAVVDCFTLEPLRAVRILFNESGVESVRVLDPATQSSGAFLEEVMLTPASPGPPGGPAGRVFDWVAAAGPWLSEEGLEHDAPRSPCLRVGVFPEGAGARDFGARPSVRFQGNLDLAAAQIREWAQGGMRVLLFSMNRGEDERVQELLEGRLPPGACRFLVGALRSGFVHGPDRIAAVTTSELFERSYRAAPRWLRYAPQGRRARRSDLKPGDFVVHRDYGVARYRGIRTVETGGEGAADCLHLEFRSSDRLYVPVSDFRLVARYTGAEGHRPRLSSLDSRTWSEVKERVREGVRELAEGILRVEAARAARAGHAFPPDSHMEAEFADAFPYEETEDQRRAISEVKADMTAPHPMDRLVVGDVGYGKTEVAMRACMKCVSGLKQAALLVPTTILADQHLRTFSSRFKEYPVRVAMLSRFTPKGEQRRILEGLAAGTVDVVIGTQRLLSQDVAFKDLGLVVIDEEHRFGVKDKERLKALRAQVDVLSLSATPIPRTLYQAMTGLKRVSMIQSAPFGRQPIVTWVGEWSEDRVKSAILAELGRGGQAYYVHNRVRTLPERTAWLKRLVPGARFAMVHGQMGSKAGAEPRGMEKVMWDFLQRKYEVLVASTIIESGLDIPTVNTLLVEDAQDFGLAQLYQLRGRIGRERQRAYCYLFHPPGDPEALSEEALKRLQALKEFGHLGSGLRLAMRDLEIRGAGDLLGARQHGFINAVGVEFYSELLREEVGRASGRAPAPAAPPVRLDLGVAAYLPEDYLPGELERLELYKRMLAADLAGLDAIRKELADLSGPAPAPVDALFRLMSLRNAAAEAGISEVARRGDSMEVRFRPGAAVQARAVERWRGAYGDRLRFVRSEEGDGLRVETGGSGPVAWLEEFLRTLRA